MVKVALFSAKNYDQKSFEKYRPQELTIEYYPETVTAELIKTVSCREPLDAIVVFVNDTVNKSIVDACKECGVKAILCRSAGFDRVDVVYAASQGVQVCRVPAYSPYAVAEQAVSLLCTLNRNLHVAYNRVSSGNFSIDGLVGMDLYGKTVGVIGTGKIGQILIDIMTGFGCKIAAFDIYVNATYAAKENVTYMTQDEVYACADIISIHSPLLPSTKHMINKESIAKMKKGVIILNAARGGLIDTEALLDGIESGQVGGAGLDVYEHEQGVFFSDMTSQPGITKDRTLAALMATNRVVMSAHQAFLTNEALEAISKVTIQNALEVASGKTGKELTNFVAPEMAQ